VPLDCNDSIHTKLSVRSDIKGVFSWGRRLLTVVELLTGSWVGNIEGVDKTSLMIEERIDEKEKDDEKTRSGADSAISSRR
jgi:hypothetical protein